MIVSRKRKSEFLRIGLTFHYRNLCITVPPASDNDDPVNTRFAWGGKVLDRGFGGDVKDFFGSLERDNGFEGRDRVLAVRRDEFRDLAPGGATGLPRGCF